MATAPSIAVKRQVPNEVPNELIGFSRSAHRCAKLRGKCRVAVADTFDDAHFPFQIVKFPFFCGAKMRPKFGKISSSP